MHSRLFLMLNTVCFTLTNGHAMAAPASLATVKALVEASGELQVEGGLLQPIFDKAFDDRGIKDSAERLRIIESIRASFLTRFYYPEVMKSLTEDEAKGLIEVYKRPAFHKYQKATGNGAVRLMSEIKLEDDIEESVEAELKKKKKPGSKTPQTSLPLTKANGVDEAKKSKAQLVFAMVQQSLQMYRIHCSVYPTTAIGLKGLEHSVKSCKSWRGPYIEAAQLIDPWGTRLSYTNEENIFILKSAGPDKKHGTEDDL